MGPSNATKIQKAAKDMNTEVILLKVVRSGKPLSLANEQLQTQVFCILNNHWLWL